MDSLRFAAKAQYCHIRSGPLIRSWLVTPRRRISQATGAPSGVAMSASLIALEKASSCRAVTTECTLQIHTYRLWRAEAQLERRWSACFQFRESIWLPITELNARGSLRACLSIL